MIVSYTQASFTLFRFRETFVLTEKHKIFLTSMKTIFAIALTLFFQNLNLKRNSQIYLSIRIE